MLEPSPAAFQVHMVRNPGLKSSTVTWDADVPARVSMAVPNAYISFILSFIFFF